MATAVRDTMTLAPTTVTPSTAIDEAATLMATEDVGSLPVVVGTRLVGMITDRDIVTRVVADSRDPARTVVGDIASTAPVTVEAQEDLQVALVVMATHQLRRLPVMDGENLVGILAQADIAREAKPKATGAMLEEISEPLDAHRTPEA